MVVDNKNRTYDLLGRLVAERLVRSLSVIEREILRQAHHQFRHVGVSLQVHILVLHVAPQTLNKDVIQCSSAPVHADGDAFALEHVGEGRAGELRTLVAVEHFRLAMVAQPH